MILLCVIYPLPMGERVFPHFGIFFKSVKKCFVNDNMFITFLFTMRELSYLEGYKFFHRKFRAASTVKGLLYLCIISYPHMSSSKE